MTQRVRVPLDAPNVPEGLRGTTWDVPSNVTQKLSWVISKYNEEEARRRAEEAAAEALAIAEARDQEVLQQRISEVQIEVVEGEQPEVEVEADVPQSHSEILSLSASLNNVTASLLTQTRETERLQQAVAEMISSTAEQLLRIEQTGIDREEAAGVAKNALQIQNAAMESLGAQIREAENQLNVLRYELGELLTEASAAREVVRTASVLTGEVRDIARQESQQLIERESDEFTAFLSLVLRALGLDRSTLNQALNASRVDGADVFLTRNFVRQAASIAKSWEQQPDALSDIKQADVAVNPAAFEVPVQG